jgi:hypothetical protein
MVLARTRDGRRGRFAVSGQPIRQDGIEGGVLVVRELTGPD